MIIVNAGGVHEQPADLVKLTVNLTSKGKESSAAFRDHKKLENKLTDLLKEFEMEEEQIYYEPLQIRSSNYPERPDNVQIYQRVEVTVRNLDRYPELQLKLVDAGFTDFGGRFGSSKADEGRDAALKNAIANAKTKAEIIAKETGQKLSDIVQVVQGSIRGGVPNMVADAVMVRSERDGSMWDFKQKVRFQSHIEIHFKTTGL